MNNEIRTFIPPARVGFRGIFEFECYDKNEKFKWAEKTHNICTDQGLNHILNVEFHGATQVGTWYLLIFETNTTPDGDTTYQVPVFTECVAYGEGTRPIFVEIESVSKSLDNTASPALFTINAGGKTIYGGALVGGPNAATKGNVAASNFMYCAAKLTSPRVVEDTDKIYIKYTVTSADDAV